MLDCHPGQITKNTERYTSSPKENEDSDLIPCRAGELRADRPVSRGGLVRLDSGPEPPGPALRQLGAAPNLPQTGDAAASKRRHVGLGSGFHSDF